MAKTKPAVAAPSARLKTRDSNDIGEVVDGLHAMYRLAVRAIDEMRGNCGDAPSYVVAIRDLCWAHGKRLDDCHSRLEGGAPTSGCFDESGRAANG
jgi:hypothetical protein